MFRAYEVAKSARQRIDFADLIALPTRILMAHPELMQQYREKYVWVMVDEYQDVSRAVARLLCHLCGAENPPWVVGDTRQAIYRFRGAAPENVEQFAQDFPGARVFHLTTNYRSCASIIQAANQLAMLMEAPDHTTPDYPERWIPPQNPCGALGDPAVAVAIADADRAEQAGIVAQVRHWLAMDVPAQDIAILARRNIDVRNIVLALGTRGIPATTSGLLTAEGPATWQAWSHSRTIPVPRSPGWRSAWGEDDGSSRISMR